MHGTSCSAGSAVMRRPHAGIMGRGARTLLQGLDLVRSGMFRDCLLKLVVRAEASDPTAKAFLQLQKAMTVTGTLGALGSGDVDAVALYPDVFYTPIAKYLGKTLKRFASELAG